MNNGTKKEYLAKLNVDKFFNHALSLTKDEEERRKIRAYAEDVFINLLMGLQTTQKIVNDHPEKLTAASEVKVSKDEAPKIIKDK